MPMITALLMAAGLSRRWGETNKLLAEVGDEPMITRTARAICASRVDRVIAVLGHESKDVAAALLGLPIDIIINQDYEDGLASSVRAGLWAVDRKPLGVMVCLADQPLLTPADYDSLIDGFLDQPSRVIVPFYNGQRANPVILPAAFRADILAGDVNLGCRRFIERHPDLVTSVPVSNPAFAMDFDTPEALSELAGHDLTAI